MCGLRSEAIQSRLLSEDGLTLQRALEIAQAQKAAKRDAQKFQDTADNPVTLSRIKEEPSSSSSLRLCYRC